MNEFQLAQINIARGRHPIDDPAMADFTGNLDRINALAERSEGFVWRLKDDTGNATSIRAYDDPLIIVNMSVWMSIEALKAFAYKTAHKQFVRRRAEWFTPMDGPFMALWWVETGTIPTAGDGRAKLEELARTGPSPSVFTFALTYEPPVAQTAR